jgi:phage tail sheath protein FI
MGFFSKILIAPGYSQNADIATAMLATANALRGMALIDSPPNTPVATAIANRGVAGNAFDTSSTRAILCYPQETYFDTGLVPTGVTMNGTNPVQSVANLNAVGPYSQWVAGAIALKDLKNGYWWSPSNTEASGILGPDVTLYASIMDAASDVNNLNAAGILTVFNAFGTGLRDGATVRLGIRR